MAHDPKREDYQRLSLRFANQLDVSDPVGAARAFASFGRRFAQDRDSLPQTDADRAMHLVAMACEVVDYRLPFASDPQAEQLIARGKALLDEALSLDPNCFDALRMRSSSEAPNVEARYQFLKENAERVRAFCEAQRKAAVEESLDEGESAGDASLDERTFIAADLAMRPWHRWLASLAEEALICGRNRAAVAHAEELLASDAYDSCDVRFTLAYALAKLEDEQGLEELRQRYPKISPLRAADDAWITLASAALAHKRFDLEAARQHVRDLLKAYPTGGAALIRQIELPDGEFSRINVTPYSEDEMILAVSEGIVLLQEGVDRAGRGVFGSWLAATVAELDSGARHEADLQDQQDSRGVRP